MAVIVEAKDHKENSTVQSLANQIIPDKLSVGITHQEFEDCYAAGIPIDNFRGGVIVDIDFLDEEVPEGFPRRSYIDEEDNEVIKKWREYTLYYTNEKRDENDNITTEATQALLDMDRAGYCSAGRTKDFDNDELVAWCDYFGDGLDLSRILTFSEFKHQKTTMFNPYYVPEEEAGVDINQDGVIKSFFKNLLGI